MKLLENQRITKPTRQEILAVYIRYIKKEMEKFNNNPHYCPKGFAQDLCQMPPTFYIWMRKLRNEMILDEIVRGKLPTFSSIYS